MRLTFSLTALRLYGQLVGDMNPVHADEHAIVHGGLLLGLMAAYASREFPGTVCAHATLTFLRPVRVREEVSVDLRSVRELGEAREVELLLDGVDGGRVKAVLLLTPWKE